jgi:NAD(P)H-dependent flavin oxidoreductase YrpB (nitropropane dioxygenase family)
MFKGINSINYRGREVLPLVEGGKGVSATNHLSSGAWAAAGGIGTVSAVNADSYDPEGKIIPQIYSALTRRDRHEELINYAIEGATEQVRRAYELSNGRGAININVLWEMGGAQRILHGVLERTRGMVAGVTCGAGMPYKLSEIAASYGVSYLPIISSARAFSALWKRAYSKFADYLSAVVYEDPWLAGGHNGLSNAEDPLKPQDPIHASRRYAIRCARAAFRRRADRDGGRRLELEGMERLDRQSGAWPDRLPVRHTSAVDPGKPDPADWKARLMTLEEGDVLLHRFSPTGFYSSAVRNPFLRSLEARSHRQIAFTKESLGDHSFELDVGVGTKKNYWVTRGDLLHAREWYAQGYTEALKTPDETLVFVTPEEKTIIRKDQADCMGCLSQCAFSSWADNEKNSTGRLADPRSFCIQKTLQDIAHGGPVEENLMFAGHAAFRFKKDPFYSNGFVPTVKQLVERIQTGD